MDHDEIQSLNDIHGMKRFLNYCIETLDSHSPQQKVLLCSFIKKWSLLQKNQNIEDEDWDYISFGLLLKQWMKPYTSRNESD